MQENEEQVKWAKEIIWSESDAKCLRWPKKSWEKEKTDWKSWIRNQNRAITRDPNDDKDVFPGTQTAAGGDEAWLFGAELLRCT